MSIAPVDWEQQPDPAAVPDLRRHALSRGRLQMRQTNRHPRMRYYLWAHPDPRSGAPLLIAVHGISRDAREQIRLLQPEAARQGISLIAPIFDEVRYAGYQQLGIRGAGERADHALLAMLADVEELLGSGSPIDLFGFSGGAQFAHRFALLYPRAVRRLALAAAGWYTLPDLSRGFPYGLAGLDGTRIPDFDLAAFLRIPQLVMVGSEDLGRDPGLRKRRRLDREQGRHRLARAVSWATAMQDLGRRHALDPGRCRLRILRNTGHDFSEAVLVGSLDKHLFHFLDNQD